MAADSSLFRAPSHISERAAGEEACYFQALTRSIAASKLTHLHDLTPYSVFCFDDVRVNSPHGQWGSARLFRARHGVLLDYL